MGEAGRESTLRQTRRTTRGGWHSVPDPWFLVYVTFTEQRPLGPHGNARLWVADFPKNQEGRREVSPTHISALPLTSPAHPCSEATHLVGVQGDPVGPRQGPGAVQVLVSLDGH